MASSLPQSRIMSKGQPNAHHLTAHHLTAHHPNAHHLAAWAGKGAWPCVIFGYWLGFPNMLASLPLLATCVPLGLAVIGCHASSTKKALVHGWLAAFIGHVLALYWLCVPISQVGGLPLWAAIPCALFVCLALAGQGALFALAARRFWVRQSALSGLAMALVWYFLEWAFALVAGFPWLPLSGALAVWPWTMQLADTLGATLVGSLWAGAILVLAGGLFPLRIASMAAGIVLVLVLALYGQTSGEFRAGVDAVGPREAANAWPEPSDDPDAFPLLLVEGNIDQNQKWVEAFLAQTVDTYVSLTRGAIESALARGEAMGTSRKELSAWLARGLIVWPETAMPFDLARAPHTRRIMALAMEAGMPLTTGSPARDVGNDGRVVVYNRLWLLNRNGFPAGTYDKEHLVPFGEYVPSFFRWKFLEGLLQEVGAYTEGTRTGPLTLGALSMGPLICYEAVFPWLANERVNQGANVLLDVSNDGWFGDTAAPWQHLALTGLRAVEQNRYLVRCTNTGISAVFDNRGRLVFQGPQFTAEALWARARTVAEKSRFNRIFHTLPIVCAVLCATLLFFTRRKPDHASAQ